MCGTEFNSTKEHKHWCVDCYNKVHKEVVCPICKKVFRQKFQNEVCCSKKCAKILQGNFKNKEILQKIANTNIKKYGYSNPFCNSEIQKKCIQNKTAITKNHLSKDALTIYKTLKNDGIHTLIEKEKIFNDCTFKSYLPFDFYIPSSEKCSELLIEYDGEQHKKPVKFGKNQSEYKAFIHTQITDWLKDKYCIENNLNLARVPSDNLLNSTFEDIYKNSYIVNKACNYDNKLDVFNINECDFVNYKEPTFIIYSGISCTFKCNTDSKINFCQNYDLLNQKVVNYGIKECIKKYASQNFVHTITFQGLEPLDNLKQLLWFIYYFRQAYKDKIIIWTGYTKEECEDLIYLIKEKMSWNNIIIKFGRFVPNKESHYDEVLGIKLASPNQYAERIS